MPQRYSLGAIVLHWLIAALLAFQLAVGFGLEDLGTGGFATFQLHKSVGILILLLTLLRIAWRLFAPRPRPVEGGWQGMLAGAVHVGLYVFMLGAPLTGWLLVSTDKVKVPTLLFGRVPWPHIPAPAALNEAFEGAHGVLAWLGIALFVLHVAGALRHQFQRKDGLLVRMSLGRRAWPVLFLAALMPIAWVIGMAMIQAVPKEAKPAPNAVAVPDEAPAPAPATAAAENAAAATPLAQPSEPVPLPRWSIQPGGTLAFSVKNGDVAVAGRFAKWSGEIAFDPAKPESADIRITVDLASATTADATQDQMLTGADFLDAAAHPRAIFKSTSARSVGPDRYVAEGTLSLKGKSRKQSLRFTLSGMDASRHVQGNATIDREAFGIGAGEAAATLAPNVALTFRFDARSNGTHK